MSENPFDSFRVQFHRHNALMLSLRMRMDAIVETVGKEVIALRGNQEWQRIYAALERSYVRGIEAALTGIEDKNPELAAALQEILDSAGNDS